MRAISCSASQRARICVLRLGVLCVFALIAIPPSRAQQPDFKALAVQAARAVEDAKAESVVVFDFVGPDTYVSELGREMADQFSTSLANTGGKFRVIDRAKMRQAVESNRFAPEIVAEPEMATWLAKSVSANSAIFGKLSLDGSALKLTVDCFRVKDDDVSGSFRVTYPLTDVWKALIARNVDPDSGVASMDKDKPLPQTQQPGCRDCPRPDFPKAARYEKYQGAVVMLVVIGKDGRARDFRVAKSLRYGLTLAAVQAVQKWAFSPAKGQDGEPIDLRFPIEVVFR
jgi:TonB family protein